LLRVWGTELHYGKPCVEETYGSFQRMVGGERCMPMYFDIDEVFRDIEKVMRRMQDSAFEFNITEESNGMDGESTEDAETKGYMIEENLEPEPLEPVEPLVRRRRPPLPGRFVNQDNAVQMNEPLVDVFDREGEVKVYIELPYAIAEDVQLNVTEGGIEVKTRDFYKVIRIPANIDIGKASSRQRNRLLEVTLPKKERPQTEETHRIVVE
jgi:HSP20 family molecular chaperone IbpA